MSKKGKFVSSGFGSSRSEAKGVWLPSLMPCCAGLAAKKLTPYPTVAKNAFQEQSKQVFFTSPPERFLGSWLEGLDEPFTVPQMTGRRDSQSTFSSQSNASDNSAAGRGTYLNPGFLLNQGRQRLL